MKILIKIKDDKLSFYNKKKLNTEYKSMLNTNVISNDEVVFSDDYIKQNYNIVYSFLNELIKQYNLTTITFQNNDLANLIFPILGNFSNISILYFESEEILPYKFYEKIIKFKNIKYISAGYIPQYLFEGLDKYGIIPESRNEILFTSNFMELNGLNTYASLYYKYTVYLDFPLSDQDKEDFEIFCDINRQLKIVHVNTVNRKDLEEILNILKENKHKNIKFVIHEDLHSPDVLEFLKKHNKQLKKKYKINIKLSYSQKFIAENIVKETNNDLLKYISIIVIILGIGAIGLVMLDNYKSLLRVTAIQEEIETHIIAEEPDEEIINELEQLNDRKITNKYIASLMSINPEVIGWLKVNNTNIDYPILQHADNKYYLDYNIYGEPDPNGWLFIDSENRIDASDDNTIIYGHNRYHNGVMFGTLNNVINKKWYTDSANQIITFDTLYNSNKYQIVSIYIVNETSDYITTNFFENASKQEFIDTILTRSIYNFNVDVNINSKVLTLSTCYGTSQRLVLHAVLIDS